MNDERLARIETLLEHLTEKMESSHALSDERWKTMHRTMFGDGNGYKGLLVRFDRIEMAEKARTWRERTLAGAVIALAARTIWTMITASG